LPREYRFETAAVREGFTATLSGAELPLKPAVLTATARKLSLPEFKAARSKEKGPVQSLPI
jgi:hypothetical protein